MCRTPQAVDRAGRRHEHEFVALSVSRKRVERLPREAGLQGAFLRKRWRTGSTRIIRQLTQAVTRRWANRTHSDAGGETPDWRAAWRIAELLVVRNDLAELERRADSRDRQAAWRLASLLVPGM
jgi:hypothetical protein